MNQNQNNILISVIIPFYERREFLFEAINSVLSIEHNSCEILIIDDGSSEESYNFVLHSIKDHTNIKLLSHPDKKNHGAGPTRNLGLKLARGKYICFLDSDDLYFPNRFSKCIPILESDPTVDGVYDWSISSIEAGGENRARSVRPLISFDSFSPDNVLDKIITKGKHWSMNAITLRKSILDETGGFSDKLRHCEDLVLWLKLACVAKLVKGSEDPVSVYRLHSSNTSSVSDLDSIELPLMAFLEVYCWSTISKIPSVKQDILRNAVFSKLFYVCGKYRMDQHPRKAVAVLFKVLSRIPALSFRRLFWGNFFYSVLELLFIRFLPRNGKSPQQ